MSSADPLVVGRVIGDVVDMFIPSVAMSVYFGPKHVTNGCDIKPSIAINQPRITLTGNRSSLYTLVTHHHFLFNLACISFNNFLTIFHLHAGYDWSWCTKPQWTKLARVHTLVIHHFLFFISLFFNSIYIYFYYFSFFRIVVDIPGGTNPKRGIKNHSGSGL